MNPATLTTFTIRFPWPDSRLSSNSRRDRRALTEQRRVAREVGWGLIREAGISMDAGPLELGLLFCPPDKRRRDWDNVGTAFKSYQDGIFRALQMDDSLIRRVLLEWGPVEKGGSIYVTLQNIVEEA